LAEDLKFELSILATVQGFYQKLMRDSLGGDVPVPAGSMKTRFVTPKKIFRKLFPGCIVAASADMAITPPCCARR